MDANDPIPIEQGLHKRLQAAYALLNANLTRAEVEFHLLHIALEEFNGLGASPVVHMPLAPEFIGQTAATVRQARQAVYGRPAQHQLTLPEAELRSSPHQLRPEWRWEPDPDSPPHAS
jgi:hypothetical protein